jgi:WD40 repeat protein
MRPLAAAVAVLIVAGCGGGSRGITAATAKRAVELERGRAAGQVLGVAWSQDGKTLAAGAPDGVLLLDPSSGRPKALLRTDSQVWGVAWSEDGVVAAASEDGAVRAWRGLRRIAEFNVRDGPAFCVSWSGRRLAAGYADGHVIVWNVERRRAVRTLTGHTAEVIAASWSPDGRRLASGSIDATVRIRDRESETLTRPEGADVNGVAWSPDGRRLAAANQDGVVRVWDVDSRKVGLRLRGHEGWTRGIDWSPNGDLLASSGADGTVRIWDAESGKELRSVKAGGQEAWSVAWSPDGRRLASGDGDGTVGIWGLR